MDSLEIRNRRKALNLTQHQFAEKLGVAVGTIINWEKGKYYYEPFVIPWESIKTVYRVIGVIKRNQNSSIK